MEPDSTIAALTGTAILSSTLEKPVNDNPTRSDIHP
jgi:hypothetical protein